MGGPDTRTWKWEHTLNIFSNTTTFPGVPERTDVIAPAWLKWGVNTHVRGPSNDGPKNLLTAETMTLYTSYYAVADMTEELEKAFTPFARNAAKILDSLLDDTNEVARRATFDTAAKALGGTAALLTRHAAPLEQWRDKVGHRGDDFQGTGAGAFHAVLDGLAFRCRNLVDQMSQGRTSWDALTEAQEMLRQATVMLNNGFQRWRGAETFSYDTGLGFRVTGAGADLAWPAGVVRAIWTAPELVADIRSHGPVDYMKDQDSYPVSTILGGRLTEAAPWLKLENAAKKVWGDHLVATLDGWAAGAAGLLTATYRVAQPYLPPIETRLKLDLHGPGQTGGSGDGGPGAGGDSGPEGGPGSGDGGPGPRGGDGSTGGSFTNSGAFVPPPLPVFGGNGPPPPVGPNNGGTNSFLKVPGGSYVGRDGVVIGPNGRPVLGRDGRPIIVPPGSRVNANGEIIGPRGGGVLEQKDRLRRPFPPPSLDNGGESALDRHLKSMRRTPPPIAPVRPPDLAQPVTMSKFDPLSGFHSGQGPLGGGRVGVSSTLSFAGPGASTAAPPTTGPLSTTGPKGTAGNGGVPFYPPTAGGPGGAGQQKNERDRSTWLAEDEETWGTDPTVAPGVLGRRKRKTPRRQAVLPATGDTERDYTLGLGGQATGQGAATG